MIPIPPLYFWICDAAFAFYLCFLMSTCIACLRSGDGRKWRLVSGSIFLYIACVSISFSHNFFIIQLDSYVNLLKSPQDHAIRSEDWGQDLAKEKRTEISLTLARNAFIEGGRFRDYIDINGSILPYIPTEEDHQSRTKILSYITQLENAIGLIFYSAFIWLLMPLLAVCLGFSSWSRQVKSAISRHIKFRTG